MVDAADLKSAVAKAAYGFESRPRHTGFVDDSSDSKRVAQMRVQPGTLGLVTLSIEIPEATLRALGPSPSEAEGTVRLAAAMKLHELGQLSSGAAAELAGISKVAFLHKLADFGVDAFRMTPEELARDLDTLRRSLG
jgi:predicted HTH domain antitoxin